MNRIDNNGRGNCMYYAYSISLMYFLRVPKNQALATKIFERLELSPEHHDKLIEILVNNSDIKKEISNDDLSTIQDILGPALRCFAATSVGASFTQKPHDSALFAAASFGIRNAIAIIKPQLQSLVTDPFGNYNKAEIFNVQGIKNAMTEYAKQVITELEPFKDPKELDKQIDQKIIEFFTKDHCKHLNDYIARLKTDKVWGSEETLIELNTALMGERTIRYADGRLDITRDFELPLKILKNCLDTSAQTFTKAILDYNPETMAPEQLSAALENRPGYILYDDSIYYIGIDSDQWVVRQKHALDKISNYDQLDWGRAGCLDHEQAILAKTMQPRTEDIKYLKENFAIILNNEYNTHWTSFIPQQYLDAPELEMTRPRFFSTRKIASNNKQSKNYSPFWSAILGGAVGEIVYYSIQKTVKDFGAHILGLTSFGSNLALVLAIALVFAIAAVIINKYQSTSKVSTQNCLA